MNCIQLRDMVRPRKRQIGVSRSFGRDIEAYGELKEAVAHYATRACEKLRANGTLARALTVFVTTNSFRADRAQYSKGASIKLPRATAYTPEIIAQTHARLARVNVRGMDTARFPPPKRPGAKTLYAPVRPT